MATNTRETSRHSSVTMGNTRLMLAMSFLPQNCEISTAEPLASPSVAAVKSDVTALACETPANAISPTFPRRLRDPRHAQSLHEEIRLTIMSSRYTTSRKPALERAGQGNGEDGLKKVPIGFEVQPFHRRCKHAFHLLPLFSASIIRQRMADCKRKCPLFPRICGKLHASFYVSGV